MNQIQSLAKTISAYIDMYDEETLSPEEATIIIESRTIILESLAIPMDEKISKKKERKMIKKLDDSFSNIIKIFSESKKPNAEILETIKAKRANKKEQPTVVKELKEVKASVPTKKAYAQFEDLMDLFAKRIDEVGNDQDSMNLGMIAVLETMAKMAKEIEGMKNDVNDLLDVNTLSESKKKKKKQE